MASSEETLVVLGLGSNQGDSPGILTAAREALGTALEELRCASFIRSEPLYVRDQPAFLNTALCGYYHGEPEELLAHIQGIEAALGRDRRRERRWGERTVDIDILLFGNRVVSLPPVLEIPHPRLQDRRFALYPLLELLPGARDPVSGRTYRSCYEELPPQGIYSIGEGGYTQIDGYSERRYRP